ncbi:MAG: MFS transporter [Oscillospiraceae bacterium]|nr:MFS transporter [Oscillospiraceae bacterium]
MTTGMKRNLFAMALEAFYWMSNCAYGAFIVTTLTDYGYNPATASAIMTVMAVVAFATQPITGYICDNYFPHWKVYIVLIGCSFPLYLLLVGSMRSMILTIACMILITLSMLQLPGLVDAWVLRMQRDDPSINYGLCRGSASLMYATVSLIMGGLTTAYGHSARMILGVCMGICSVAIALILHKQGLGDTGNAKASVSAVPAEERLSTRETIRILAKNKAYVHLLVMVCVIWLGSSCNSTFLPTLVKELGGDSGTVGATFSINAYCEVPGMFLISLILRRFKAKNVITFAAAAYVLKMAATGFAPNLPTLLVVQMLQGVSFALIWPACINYLNRIVDDRVKSTAVMTFSAASLGISPIFANAIGTAILSATGDVRMVFVYSVCATSCGLLIAVYGHIRKIWK